MNRLNSKKEIVLFFLKERWFYRLLIVFLAVLNTGTGLLVPFAQRQFTETYQISHLLLATGLTFLSFFCFQLTGYIGTYESLEVQHKLGIKLYNYFLKLKNISSHKSTGEKVAVYTTDIPSSTMWLEQSIPYFLTTLFPLLVTPFFLEKFYNLPFSFSALVITILFLFNFSMAFRQSRFFYKFKILAAERMGVVNEWIQNIKFLRTIHWMDQFEKRIFEKRRKETYNRIQMVTNGQIMNSFSSSMTFWLNLFVLLFICSSYDAVYKTHLTKNDLFVLFWVMGIFLSRPLRQLPWLITMFFDASTSAQRIADSFQDKNDDLHIQNNPLLNSNEVLKIKNLNLKIQEKTILSHIDLTIHKGELVGLIGPVGSGKSLLLKSLLQETPFIADQFKISNFAYLPQEPFIMSASLRDNLALEYDSKLEDHKAHSALKMAEFDIRLDRVSAGLETEVGERGLNLSGGQKQRLSLARIFLNPVDLVLLDDPMSAVDVHTEEKLIRNFKLLQNQGTAFLLSTQRYQLLQKCDRIVFIQHGKIHFNGTYSDFIQVPKFKEFLLL